MEINHDNLFISLLPNEDVLAQCIHCGLCLATCPTYSITQLERSSPRGRIRLINAVAKCEINISKTFAYEMDFCLDCQACETACPAGVKYGPLVEAARVIVRDSKLESLSGRMLKKYSMKIVVSKRMLKIAAKLLYFYQNSGLQKLLHSSGIFKLFFPKLSEIDKLSPKVSRRFSSKIIPEKTLANGKTKYKAAIHTGCLMDVMFAEVNKDTVDVLSMCECEVLNPGEQVCCGSLPGHNGDYETARKLARKNIDVFEKLNCDFLIVNSSGCGAFMKEYVHLLKDDPVYSERAKLFSFKVKDILEFLDKEAGEIKFKSLNEKVTYHDACHHIHSRQISNEPRNILKSIPGLELKPLDESTWCCGSAGIYNLIHYEDSMKILERKMNNIKSTGADIVLAANHGCIAQLKYGAERFRVDVEVIHPVSLIKKALKKNSS